MKTLKIIKKQILENPILLYMKGSPKKPSCGFSAKAAKIVSFCVNNFKYIDVLENIDIKIALPKYAQWPTFPQLWVQGKLIGGCDIINEMYKNGELQNLFKQININHK